MQHLMYVCVTQLKIELKPANNEMSMYVSFATAPEMRLQVLPSGRPDVSKPYARIAAVQSRHTRTAVAEQVLVCSDLEP